MSADVGHPYEPPAERAGAPSRAGWMALALWIGAGACVGTAIGATLQVTWMWSGAAGTGGAMGILGAAVLGAVAMRVERQLALRRPTVLDSHGRRGRPLHGALSAVPAALAVPALIWLAVVGAVALGSPLPVGVFGTLALITGWAGVRAVAAHQLIVALEAVERGELDRARRALERLQPIPFTGARAAARLHLGWLMLQQGELDAAARWYRLAMSGRAEAHGAAGLALVCVLQERYDSASEVLARAMSSAGARQVQAQVDAVRLLLLWRTEGEAEALAFGERMAGPESGALFQGLLAVLRRRAGAERAGLRDASVPLAASGLLGIVPELRELGDPTP